MSATKKQRFTLYLLTLLFIWVNGFAAPYQSIQNASSDSEFKLSVLEAPATQISCNVSVRDDASFQQPINTGDRGIHSAYPAEEAFEEQEEAEQKDELGFKYVSLPEYLTLNIIAKSSYPVHLPHHELYSAVRKQSTYLLDCTFLI